MGLALGLLWKFQLPFGARSCVRAQLHGADERGRREARHSDRAADDDGIRQAGHHRDLRDRGPRDRAVPGGRAARQHYRARARAAPHRAHQGGARSFAPYTLTSSQSVQ
eukprot:6187776-Pleurochrysis_carterae.AAC.2